MSNPKICLKAAEEWLDEKKVAVITGLSVSTLQKHRYFGRGIPYAKIGKAVRYSLTDVTAFMISHVVAPRARG